jgi:hypothetical protein
MRERAEEEAGLGRFAGDRLPVLLSRAYLGLVAIFVLDVSWRAYGRHLTIANFDDWRVLAQMFERPLGRWLLASQNGHRPVGTLLLFRADYEWFDGRGDLLVVASLVCSAIALAALFGVLRTGPESERRLAGPLTALAGFLLFWAGCAHDFRWGLQLCNLMTEMWSFLALAALVVYASRRALGRSPGTRLPPLARISHWRQAHRPTVPANGLLLKDKSHTGGSARCGQTVQRGSSSFRASAGARWWGRSTAGGRRRMGACSCCARWWSAPG